MLVPTKVDQSVNEMSDSKSGQLKSRIREATKAFDIANEKFENVMTFIEDLQSHLVEAFTSTAKTFDSTINPDRIQAFIEAFVKKPYFVIPISEREWWLIVPSFVNLEFGYLLAQKGAWNIFLVNQYADMIQDIPAEFKKDIEASRPFGDMEIKEGSLILKNRSDNVKEVKSAFSEYLGTVKDTKTVMIKKGREFELFAALVRQGILPFKFNKVLTKHKHKVSRFKIELRDYQQKDYETFEKIGACGILYPMGGGKSFPPLKAIADLVGKKLILVPNGTIAQNWLEYILNYTEIPLEEIAIDFSPRNLEESLKKEVHIMIYNEKNLEKIRDVEYIFGVFDEAPLMITRTRIEFAQLNILHRMTTTGTPFREDGNEDLLFALMVRPLGVDWKFFIEHGLIKVPEIQILVEKNGEAKRAKLMELIDYNKKTLIFCDTKKIGYELAKQLEVPYVSGDIKNIEERLSIIRQNRVVIVSRIADMGISVKDLEVIIEYDFLFGSRHQEAQRVGRLFHSEDEGIYYALVTLEEYNKFSKRFLELFKQGLDPQVIRSDDISFRDLSTTEATKKPKKQPIRRSSTPKRSATPTKKIDLSKFSFLDERDEFKGNHARKMVLKILSTDHAVSLDGLTVGEIKEILDLRHIKYHAWYTVRDTITGMYKVRKLSASREGPKKRRYRIP